MRDDAGRFELLQALREQRRRHPRNATAQFVEARRAREHLAQQNNRPARAQYLGGHRDRTELLVAACSHLILRSGFRGKKLWAVARVFQFSFCIGRIQFLNWRRWRWTRIWLDNEQRAAAVTAARAGSDTRFFSQDVS